MKEIIVYGSGCKNCQNTKALIRRVADELGIEANIGEVTDTVEIMSAGVMSTPGVAVDGQIVHTGSHPSREQVEEWLRS